MGVLNFGSRRGRPKGGSTPLNEVSRDDAIYAAGLFDGEGSVSIPIQRKTGAQTIYHRLRVSISNTDFRIMEWLERTFGGKVYIHLRGHERFKDAYTWSLRDSRAEEFLRIVRHALKLKGEQADLAFELRATKGRGRPGGPLRGADLFAHREAIRQRLMRLNHRGKEAI